MKLLKVLTIFLCVAGVSGLSAKTVGKLALVIGKVEVRVKGAKWKRARIGMQISDKMSINTSFRSKAVIAFDNNCRLKVGPTTFLSLKKYTSGGYGTQTNLHLSMGAVTAYITRVKKKGKKNHFRISTPTAVAGVRGTIEEVRYSPEKGMTIDMIEAAAEVVNALGESAFIPEKGRAIAERENLITPERAREKAEKIVLNNQSMSKEEAENSFDQQDATFGGASDLEEFGRSAGSGVFDLDEWIRQRDALKIDVEPL